MESRREGFCPFRRDLFARNCCENGASDSFEKSCDPNEDDRADKRHDNRADHPSGGPDSQTAEKPTTKPTTDNAQEEVHDDAVASAFHHEPGKPTCDETNNEPINHAYLLGLDAVRKGKRALHLEHALAECQAHTRR